MEWKQKSTDKVSLLSCLTSVSAFIENSSCAWKSFTPVLISYFLTVPSGSKGSVRFVDGVGRGRVEPGGAEGTTTANEASVGQSIPRPRRVSIRCFFSLLVDRDTEGCFRTRHPKKSIASLVLLSELCTTKSRHRAAIWLRLCVNSLQCLNQTAVMDWPVSARLLKPRSSLCALAKTPVFRKFARLTPRDNTLIVAVDSV